MWYTVILDSKHVSGYTLPTIYRIWRGLGVRQSISRDFRLYLCLFGATFHGFYLLYCSSNVWSVIRHIVFFPKVRALSGISFFLRSLLLKLAFSWQLLSKCPRYSTVLTTVRWSLPGILTGKKKISMEYLRRFQISPLQNVKKTRMSAFSRGQKWRRPGYSMEISFFLTSLMPCELHSIEKYVEKWWPLYIKQHF